MNRQLCIAAFGLGLAALAWVAYGYVGTHPLALAMTVLMAAFYLMGALELRRFHQATAALAQALAAIPDTLSHLGDWLATLPAPLQNPVRLRVEGERVALPGPVMTPFLVGLLVLLGMLGTFLGMVVTLKGAVQALQATTDLPALRAALTAPVQGLGLAFGTSVAGVAASAVLGLMSALCRRERLQVAQTLDTRIATVLRVYTRAHQRDESFKTLQAQAQLMPLVAERLQAMMAQMERQSLQLSERLLANQDSFHQGAQAVYGELARSVDRSLQHSLTESARLAGAALQPVVEATMAGIARETTALHAAVAHTVQTQLEGQLDGLSSRFERTVTTVAQGWEQALAQQARNNDALSLGLNTSLQQFNEGFEQRAAALLATVQASHSGLQHELQTTLSGLASDTASLHHHLGSAVQQQLAGVSARFDSAVSTVSATWVDALAQQQRGSASLAADMQTALSQVTHSFAQGSTELLANVDRAHLALQTELAAKDEQRLAAWQQSLSAMAGSLQQAWQQAGAQTLSQQTQICATLERTARDISSQAEAHAHSTITEIGQLMQAASEAPRVAAEVIGQLRQQLSTSIANDNAMLEERSHIMATLATLLDAVQHASTEQRGAIDALLSSTASVLEQVGQRFTEQVAQESDKLGSVAAEITGSAVDVASLGEAFGHGVQLFSESNDKLMVQLQRIEGSLSQSLSRSDEQLAYYVAQAREIIDLSILSQKQIVEDLQQRARQPAHQPAHPTAALADEVA